MLANLQHLVSVEENVAERGISSEHRRSEDNPHSRRDSQMLLHERDFIVVGHRDLLQAHDVSIQIPNDANPSIEVPSAVRTEPLVYIVRGDRKLSHNLWKKSYFYAFLSCCLTVDRVGDSDAPRISDNQHILRSSAHPAAARTLSPFT